MGQNILIIGVGLGLSFSLARLFHNQGMKVSLASRNTDKLKKISSEVKDMCFQCLQNPRVPTSIKNRVRAM